MAQERGNEALRPWVEPVVNHFYHAAETCQGDSLKLSVRIAQINDLTLMAEIRTVYTLKV